MWMDGFRADICQQNRTAGEDAKCGWISLMFSLEFVSDEVDLVHHGVRGRDVLLLLRHWPVGMMMMMMMMMMIMMMLMSLASSLSSSLPQTLLEPGWCNGFGSLGRKILDL